MTTSPLVRPLAAAVGLLALWAVPASAAPSPASGRCVDSEGQGYSRGFVVRSGGERMQCVGPHWVPMDRAGAAPVDVVKADDPAGTAAREEDRIREALRELPTLSCDRVLNSTSLGAALLEMPTGGRVLVEFWTPYCAPCKPLLSDLAALAESGIPKLSVVSVVEAAPGQARVVDEVLAQHHVHFPTCVHSSSEQTARWQAGGVPLVLLISERGVERATLGEPRGRRLLEDVRQAAGRPAP